MPQIISGKLIGKSHEKGPSIPSFQGITLNLSKGFSFRQTYLDLYSLRSMRHDASALVGITVAHDQGAVCG
jgi:hypothetical protein